MIKQKLLVFKGLDKITAIDTDGLKIPIAFMTNVHQNENEKLREIINDINTFKKKCRYDISGYGMKKLMEIIKSKCKEV